MSAFTRATWFALPMKVRRAWWRDTDYGRKAPSDRMCELLAQYGLVFVGPTAATVTINGHTLQ